MNLPPESASPRPFPEPSPRGSAALVEKASLGWTRPLTHVVLAGLFFEIVTGFWIWLAPFSVAAQVQVLLHTVAGLLLTAPYAVYQWRHYRDWRGQTLSVLKLLGYAAMALTATSFASGTVVTFQALFSRRVTPLWERIHTASAIVVTALLLLHLLHAYGRRRAALVQLAGFSARLRRQLVGGLFASLAGYGLVLGAAIWRQPVGQSLPLPQNYSLPEYAQNFDEYRGSVFAPTYARTSTGGLIKPAVLANSASCGTVGCHEQILAEWEPSAHRFSAMNPPFQAVQKNFAQDRGPAETRYCAGCHDPISLFAGAKDVSSMNLAAPGMQEGSSCIVCHSISKADQRGNADYVVTPPTRYLGEARKGTRKAVSDFLIRAYPRQHLADYNRPVLRSPEFCAACHKQFIPEALNHFGAIPAQNQFDEWKKSHWATNHDPDKNLSCRDCHMRLVNGSTDPAAGQEGDARRTAGDGSHRHHGFVATNLFMAKLLNLPHHEEHDRLTEEWIQGRTVLPEIADVWPAGPVASIELQSPKAIAGGARLEIQAVVRNRKAGHNFTTGPLDFIRAWIHLTISDAEGAVVAEWGGIDPETHDILDQTGVLHASSGARNKGTLVLEALPLDAEGNAIVRHDLWRKAGGSGQRVVFPAHADKQSYSFDVPPGTRGPLTVKADLNFRRYRQEFLNLVVPTMEKDAGVYQPTVVSDSAVATIQVGEAAPPAAGGPLATAERK